MPSRRAIALSLTSVGLKPFDYAKSSPLYTTTIETPQGTTRAVVKDLRHSTLLGNAQHVKPEHLHDPWREIATYRDMLGDLDGPPAHLGHQFNDQVAVLVMEHVDGFELNDVGELNAWASAAACIAQLHLSWRSAPATVPVVIHDRAHLAYWIEPARNAAASRIGGKRLDAAIDCFERDGLDILERAQRSVIHGEYYPSNIVVAATARSASGQRTCPIDWATTGHGPGLIDLAALTAGSWSDQNRSKVVSAYAEAAERDVDACFAAEFAACRLALAIQWLAWFAIHSPPSHQSNNWVDEAVRAAADLEGGVG